MFPSAHWVGGGPLFSTSSLTSVIFCRLDNCHSDRCEVVSHCGFGVRSVSIRRVEHPHARAGRLNVFFGEMSVRVLCPFFNQLVQVAKLYQFFAYFR